MILVVSPLPPPVHRPLSYQCDFSEAVYVTVTGESSHIKYFIQLFFLEFAATTAKNHDHTFSLLNWLGTSLQWGWP